MSLRPRASRRKARSVVIANRRLSLVPLHFFVRRFWLLLAWPFVWCMDVGIWLLDCGDWFALRCEARDLWIKAWRKRAPNATGQGRGLSAYPAPDCSVEDRT